MKPYSILIHGAGPCGEGTAASADMLLQKLLEQLRSAGHSITSVSMVINGSAVPIIGGLQPHPAAEASADPDAVPLTIGKQLELLGAGQGELMRVLLDIDKKMGLEATEKKGGAGKPVAGGKKRGGAEKVLPEVPKDAGLDEDGKLGVTGNVPEGAMRLPGNPVAEAPEGGWPAPDLPPTSPPPDVMVDTTGDDGAGPTTNEPPNEEEGEEG